MSKKDRGLVASIKLFYKRSCYTTLITILLALAVLVYPSIKDILADEGIITLPDWFLSFVIAIGIFAILIDQLNKRFRKPDQIRRDVAKHAGR